MDAPQAKRRAAVLIRADNEALRVLLPAHLQDLKPRPPANHFFAFVIDVERDQTRFKLGRPMAFGTNNLLAVRRPGQAVN